MGGIYGVASGCGCKEVYIFPHITYPYSSCICSFLQQHPYFLFIFYVFRSFIIIIFHLFILFFFKTFIYIEV